MSASNAMAPRFGWLLATLALLGLWSCGATVPVWGPESSPEATDADEVDAPPLTDVEALAAALEADPRLRLGPHGSEAEGAPGLTPGRVIELSADSPYADPEVLYEWLLDRGILVAQIEYLLPSQTPVEPAFRGDGDPNVLRLRMRLWIPASTAP